MKNRLNKNRQQILDNPKELQKYITEGKRIRIDEFLNQAKLESENFQSVMKEFEQEETQYLSNHSELLEKITMT